MLELPVNAREYNCMMERLLVPQRIWEGGWHIRYWNSAEERWSAACFVDTVPTLEDGPFLKHEEKWARAQLACFRALCPDVRFRLQQIGPRSIINHYCDIVWDPDHPERVQWFEKWGGGSPLWRMLGRQPA